MIRHDYVCDKCNKVFEVGVPKPDSVVKCPICKSKMKKVWLKAPNAIIKYI